MQKRGLEKDARKERRLVMPNQDNSELKEAKARVAHLEKLTEIMDGYAKNPSNSNKWRYEMDAYIDSLLQQEVEKARREEIRQFKLFILPYIEVENSDVEEDDFISIPADELLKFQATRESLTHIKQDELTAVKYCSKCGGKNPDCGDYPDKQPHYIKQENT